MTDDPREVLRAAGVEEPDGARMYFECESRKALYPHPCVENTTGRKYKVPDDCPYIDTCDPNMGDWAILAMARLVAELS